MIKKIQLPAFDDYYPDEEANILIVKGLAQQSLKHVTDKYSEQLKESLLLQQLIDKWQVKSDEEFRFFSEEIKIIYIEILEVQRQWLIANNQTEKHFDEDIIRKHLRLINIEEEKLKIS